MPPRRIWPGTSNLLEIYTDRGWLHINIIGKSGDTAQMVRLYMTCGFIAGKKCWATIAAPLLWDAWVNRSSGLLAVNPYPRCCRSESAGYVPRTCR